MVDFRSLQSLLREGGMDEKEWAATHGKQKGRRRITFQQLLSIEYLFYINLNLVNS